MLSRRAGKTGRISSDEPESTPPKRASAGFEESGTLAKDHSAAIRRDFVVCCKAQLYHNLQAGRQITTS